MSHVTCLSASLKNIAHDLFTDDMSLVQDFGVATSSSPSFLNVLEALAANPQRPRKKRRSALLPCGNLFLFIDSVQNFLELVISDGFRWYALVFKFIHVYGLCVIHGIMNGFLISFTTAFCWCPIAQCNETTMSTTAKVRRNQEASAPNELERSMSERTGDLWVHGSR